MIVKDLLKEIKYNKKTYGDDFLNWDIAVEHHSHPKQCVNCKDNILEDADHTQYIKCHGFNTLFTKEKVFTINIHF